MAYLLASIVCSVLVSVLLKVARKQKINIEQAVAVMLLVHHEGKGLCGTYTRDIAQTKQQQVMQRAKAEGHPLQCIVEEI